MLEYCDSKCLIPIFHYSNIPALKIMSHGPQFEIEKHFDDPVITTVFQSWTFEPWIIIPLVLAGSIYLRGWWQLHRRLPRRFSGLALDRLPSRPAHALSRAGIAAASVGRTAAAIPYGPTSAADDGGTAAPLARRADSCRYCADCRDPCCSMGSARSSPLRRSSGWATF